MEEGTRKKNDENKGRMFSTTPAAHSGIIITTTRAILTQLS